MSRRAAARRRARRRARWRRSAAVVTVVAVGAGAVYAVDRLDPLEAIREFTLPLRHDDIIRQQAAEKDLDPALIAAVIYAESRFRPRTSHADARGLMQITPATAKVIARLSGGISFVTEDLGDPDINIRYGTFFLRHLVDRYDGNVVAALAGYNAGIQNADHWGGSTMKRRDIGFPETHAYVEEVLGKREEYRENYAEELGLER